MKIPVGQARRVVAFRKPDQRDQLTDQLMLFEEPVAPKIPPFRAVEDEV